VSSGPSLYRRHRPRSFAEMVGQEQVVRTLCNAIERGRVHHAYLFVGSRGTGKTSTAKILAASLNCVDGPTTRPCGVCESCVSIANATSLDVIEMDAASNNSVDDIRDLRERVALAPISGRHKVYILDEAHMLSTQAWNAFLKTLEEPPPRTVFVLATTEAQKVLPTVVDRCHRFDFGRPTVAQVSEVVRRVAAAEGIAIEPEAVALIARHATGSFRDALGTLEQLVSWAGERPIAAADVLAVLGVADAEQLLQAVDAIAARDGAAALRAAAALGRSGRDPGQVLRDLEAHARELLTVSMLGEVPEQLRLTPERDARLLEQSRAVGGAEAVRLLELVSAALQATANGAQAQIQLELALLKAAAPEVDPSVSALLTRVSRLEAALAGRDWGAREGSEDPGGGSGPPSGGGGGGPDATTADAGGHRAPTAASPGPADGEAGSAEPPSIALSPTQPASSDPPSAQPARADPQSSREQTPVPGGGAGAPAAPTTRAAAAAAAPANPDLRAVGDCWPAVVEHVRRDNQMLAALLADARPVALEGRELTVAFPAGKAFSKRKAEQDDYRRAAADAVRSITGQPLVVRYELGEEPRQQGEGDPAAGGGSPEELVRRLVEEFDASEVLDDDQEEAN